jgi:sRNA-binding protein
MPVEEKPSALVSAGSLDCASTPPARSLNSQDHTVDQTISALAELFPFAFTAEQWKPHRPLKRGIHNDLIERGVLLARECRVLRWYVSRRMYQLALAAGGARYNLDGQPAGEATLEEADRAKAAVAAIEARQKRRAAAARADVDKERAARKAAVALIPAEAPQTARPTDKTPPAKSGLSLDGLRAAARARREAAHG